MIPIPISLVVEDILSETVAEKILDKACKNYQVEASIIRNKQAIMKEVRKFNDSARGHPYLVLTDQDTHKRCPPKAIRELSRSIPIHPNLLYRFAAMEIESWIMAHKEGILDFLDIRLPPKDIPMVDDILQPKEYLVNLVDNKSRSRRIREGMVPPKNSSRSVGPDYNQILEEFVREKWDVHAAIRHSPSLKRTVHRLNNFQPT